MENCKDVLSPSMMLFLLEKYLMKSEKSFLIIGDGGYFSLPSFLTNVWGGSDKGWYDCKRITPDAYKKCHFDAQRKVGNHGFYSNIIENHDQPRCKDFTFQKAKYLWRAKKCGCCIFPSERSSVYLGTGNRYGKSAGNSC